MTFYFIWIRRQNKVVEIIWAWILASTRQLVKQKQEYWKEVGAELLKTKRKLSQYDLFGLGTETWIYQAKHLFLQERDL